MEGFHTDILHFPPPFQDLDGLNAMQLTRFIKSQHNVENLSRIVQEAAILEMFNYIHASTAITRAGHFLKEEKSSRRISAASTRHFSAIVQVARPFIGTMDPRGLATFIWALGCPGSQLATVDDKETLEELLRAAQLILDNFSAQALSNTAWSLAVMEHDDDPVFMAQLLIVSRSKLREFDPQSLSTFVYALARQKKRGAPDPGGLDVFLKELVQSATVQLSGFKPQDLSNTAWSLAVMEHDDPVFMTQLLAAAKQKLHEFIPQALSNMVYALAKQRQDGARDPHGLDIFLKDFVVIACARLDGFMGQELCNTIWSLITFGCVDLNFQRQARAAFELRGHTFSLRDQANFRKLMGML